jgi:diguanylate cyclase (GGDEF)-like protein
MYASRPSKRWLKVSLLIGEIVLTLCLGAFDLWTGPELSFSVFYLLPIYLAVWLLDKWAGMFISIFSGVTWLAADFMAGHTYSHPLIPYWNAAVRLSFFFTTTYLLAQLKKRLDVEKVMARTDPLTQLANGKHFYTLAEAEIVRSRAADSPLTIAYLDVDDFKGVNDRLGHYVGDQLLRLIASTLQRHIRRSDIVARAGGDEFALLMPDTEAASAQRILSALKSALVEETEREGWPVTFSIGAVTFARPPNSVDDMVRSADRLMYVAKSSGKNAVQHEVLSDQHADKDGTPMSLGVPTDIVD